MFVFLHTGKSVRETLKNTESQTDYQKTSIITSNKMIQTENVESRIIMDTISMEVRSMDECLAVYKSQVKLLIFFTIIIQK